MITATTAGDVLLIIASIPANGAPIIYSRVSWWSSNWGRHLMGYMAAVALVLDLGLLRIGWGADAWFEWVRFAAYVLLVLMLFWRLGILAQAYLEGSPNESATGRARP